MSDERIEVVAYSGYRSEECPRSFILHNEKIEVIEILRMWIEERLNDRARRRYFEVKGRDGYKYKIYYDEKEKEWFLVKDQYESS
jgi:hypothetical protein